MIKNREINRTVIFLLLFLFWSIFFLTPHLAHAEESAITITFRNEQGEPLENIPDIVLTDQAAVVMPSAALDSDRSSSEIIGTMSWKPFLSGTLDSDTQLCGAAERVSAAAIRSLYDDYGKDGTLTLYETKVLSIEYFNSDGTVQYGTDYIYEGTYGNFRTSPDANRLVYGWAKTAQADSPWKNCGSSGRFLTDLKLYAVEYITITFYDSHGQQNSSYQGLTITVRKGKYVTLPAVPTESTQYRNIGWSTSKNSGSTEYAQRQRITADRNLILYAVRKETPYTVRFSNMNGSSRTKSFYRLWQHVNRETVTMPSVPYRSGYVGLGWSTKRFASSAMYEEGDRVSITGNTRFFAVYRKAEIYTIQYYMTASSGSSTVYSDLTAKVYEDSTLTLPQIPARTGYENICWRLNVNGVWKEYTPGSRIRVKGAYQFYAKQQELPSITLCYNGGSTYRKLYPSTGENCILPAMENPSGYTFLGWSTVSGRIVAENRPITTVFYEAGDSIYFSGETMKLYAVLSDRGQEKTMTDGQIASLDTSKYSRIIFIGDSRFNKLGQSLNFWTGYNHDNMTFIAQNGSGLNWLRNTAYTSLIQILDTMDQTNTLPVAVVFNHGANDLGNAAQYIGFMNQIADELGRRNCRLFYVSVNPFNSVQLIKNGYTPRYEADRKNFQQALQSGLSEAYTLIDTYSWLMATGFSYDRSTNGIDTGIDDGLHYTDKTNRRILDRILHAVNEAG